MRSQPGSAAARKLRLLMVLPVIAIPCLFFVFKVVGRGKRAIGEHVDLPAGSAFNMTLPVQTEDKKTASMGKIDYYEAARADSIRRRQLMAQDPNFRKVGEGLMASPGQRTGDGGEQADRLLKKVDRLRVQVAAAHAAAGMGQGTAEETGAIGAALVGTSAATVQEVGVVRGRMAVREMTASREKRGIDSGGIRAADPEMEQLDEMLRRIERIQAGTGDTVDRVNREMEGKDIVGKMGDEGMVNGRVASVGLVEDGKSVAAGLSEETVAIPAVVDRDQDLVNGGTMALRLLRGVMVRGGVKMPAGQLVYGVAHIANDRMEVSVQSLCYGERIVPVRWQVFDVDGLPGIHIPDGVGRQSVRQSADQGIGGLNLSLYDPGIRGQLTNTGIQAARSFFSRKVRMVRVLAPAGYRVLLKAAAGSGGMRLSDDARSSDTDDRVAGDSPIAHVAPPLAAPAFLDVSDKHDHVKMRLGSIYEDRGILWFFLSATNKGVVDLLPGNLRVSMDQGRRVKIMARQEVTMQPVYLRLPARVKHGEEEQLIVGIPAFTPGDGQRLIIRLYESNGGRVWEVEVRSKLWSKIRHYE